MSADSGIATFRDKPESHWSRFNPDELASPEGWRNNHRRVWAWYEARRASVMTAEPNSGHLAIAQLSQVINERTGGCTETRVITQNVDDLHERSGSDHVIHLHGSLFSPRCTDCHKPGAFSATFPDLNAKEVEPPHCVHCGGLIRPGVVWFGENLPEDQFHLAENLINDCDAMLVIGTSGVVYPAADLPIAAHRLGKFVAEINPEPSELSPYMTVQWPVSAAQGMPQLLEQLRAS